MARRKAAGALAALRNLGLCRHSGWRRWARTPVDVGRLGPVEAYRRVKTARPRLVNLVMLWALVGALLDLDYREVPLELKRLEKELQSRPRPRATTTRRR